MGDGSALNWMLHPIFEVPTTGHRTHILCKILFQPHQRKGISKGDRGPGREGSSRIYPFFAGILVWCLWFKSPPGLVICL